MPSIDHLITARYCPSGPHPLSRRPWRRDSPRAASLGDRVLQQLTMADRARRRRRLSRLATGWATIGFLCGVEMVLVRWPHLGVRAADALIHLAGVLLITVAALGRIRDGLFAPPEMALAAALVTGLLLLLVATGLGCVLWGSEALAAGMAGETEPEREEARR